MNYPLQLSDKEHHRGTIPGPTLAMQHEINTTLLQRPTSIILTSEPVIFIAAYSQTYLYTNSTGVLMCVIINNIKARKVASWSVNLLDMLVKLCGIYYLSV